MGFKEYYERLNYKALMIIPVILILFSVGYLGYNKSTTGEWVEQGIDLTGGSLLTIPGDHDAQAVEDHLKSSFDEVSVRSTRSISGSSLIIEAAATEDELLTALDDMGISPEDYSFRRIGPSIGESALRLGIYSILFAFLFMSITVFIIFRKVIPSVSIVLGAAADIVVTLAFMDIFGIALSSITLAALLLIIGYSIDTDILLTTKILKRSGSVIERSISSIKTGMLMTVTTLTALIILLIFSNTPVLKDIASVLLIALLVDMPVTWILNLGILRWWKSK